MDLKEKESCDVVDYREHSNNPTGFTENREAYRLNNRVLVSRKLWSMDELRLLV
jgi:hypothetical protein